MCWLPRKQFSTKQACPANSNPPASRAGINDFTPDSTGRISVQVWFHPLNDWLVEPDPDGVHHATTSPSQWTSLIPTAHVCRRVLHGDLQDTVELLLIASALLVAPSATMLRSGRDQRYLKICPARLSNPNNAKPPFTIKTRMKITA
jgi:hypothetical protein